MIDSFDVVALKIKMGWRQIALTRQFVQNFDPLAENYWQFSFKFNGMFRFANFDLFPFRSLIKDI